MRGVLAALVALVFVVGGGVASAEAASADAAEQTAASSVVTASQSSISSSGVTVSGTLLGADGQPIVGLPVYIGDWDFEGCAYPDETHQTQADGSFSFVYDRPTWPERSVLCLGQDYYGGPTWNAQDAQFIDLSGNVDVGVVQRAPSVKVKMRWLVDPKYIARVNEYSTTQAHAINLDTGSVYRGRFEGWEGDGVWETLELPLGRYRFAVRTLWWDPHTWVYYPGTVLPEEAEVIDVREDMTLPQEVQANPGILKLGQSPWGTYRDWRIESCTTNWSFALVLEQYGDPEPNKWILPIGSYRLALHRDGELWDWTPCNQIEPGGTHETKWTQPVSVIPPTSVSVSTVSDGEDGKRRLVVEVVPGRLNSHVPVEGYDLEVISQDTGNGFGSKFILLQNDPRDPFTSDLVQALPAGKYIVSVTPVARIDEDWRRGTPVRSEAFELSELASSPTPTPSPSPTAAPTPTTPPSATATPTPAPSSSPSATPGAPPPGPISGVGGGSASSDESRRVLAETGAPAPPLAIPIFALAAVMAAGLLRLMGRGARKRRI